MFHPLKHCSHSRYGTSGRGLSLLAATGATLLAASFSAAADISVRFVESAPKDRFVITNEGDCAEGPLDVVIDLGSAPAGLIFDTTAQGAGVEVFQPFEVARGGDALEGVIAPKDGDTAVTLALKGLAPGGTFAFTVDVDDTGEASDLGQIRVSDAEISGAVVTVNGIQAEFGGDASALVASDCLS